MNISIVIPTFNESKNIISLIDEIKSVLDGINFEIIVVDDSSPDGTHEIIKDYILKNNSTNISCINRTWKKGLSSAVIEGIALSNKDYICVMDGDGQHDPKNIPHMLDVFKKENIDLIIGSRFLENSSSKSLSKKRNFLSEAGIQLCQFFLNKKITDPLSGFFIVKRRDIEIFKKVLYKDGFKILFDYLMLAKPKKIYEIQINFRKRLHGASKLNLSTMISLLGQIIENKTRGLIPGTFIIFSAVGLSGLLIHLSLLNILLLMTNNFTYSNIIGVIGAMTTNYLLNNYFTFHNMHNTLASKFIGLIKYYVTNSVPIFANIGIASQLYFSNYTLYFSVISGVFAGLILNYFLSRNIVFR
ncbi:glycosyltransferase family 2 protein [Gammaproteobacteria bacterium]|nr:glycosyltransferase family 2 protein [Gammaproteobacteria bacterium]